MHAEKYRYLEAVALESTCSTDPLFEIRLFPCRLDEEYLGTVKIAADLVRQAILLNGLVIADRPLHLALEAKTWVSKNI
ncbi:hypothetical protein C495_07405 [Natronorubrum sulfidifaciens JCM 14089]|uniref:Uncharacterized protein n=1 Tax=Natronorubrum sulfidifaciens JCM 14089 TaxID=1230460 RepID=L9W9A6_9EURY|nr:hypothetical protein C495_07405 [Natronorubrum sulfidifaciens JCM 14089]